MEAPRARQELPIDSAIPAFVAALRRTANVVVQAPTGAGKTTRIPPALLSEFGSPARLVLVVEPRRLAAQAAARRMAGERGEEVGATVGYHVRFQRSRGPQTRLLVVTEGVLLRMLLDDPWLERVEAVVFDEFHERNLQSDLALAMLRRLQQEFRPELRLVVMSATLDPDPLARYLGGEVVISEGRTFPVRIDYLTRPDDRPTPVRAADAVMRVREQTVGHVLVFLPGFGEIRRTRDELRRRLGDEGTTILELYGDLPLEAQDQVLRPSGRQKVVLATNVAETSVTIEGVTTVVDCGLARVLRYDASVGLNRLAVERIARDSADQRAGRAGRTAPGYCLRLWTEHEHRHLASQTAPEIRRLDLAGAQLQLWRWGEHDWESFPWFEAPPAPVWEQAGVLLRRLGALEEGGLTRLGEQLALLPLHPRLARLVYEGQRVGCGRRAALAAALLSERSPLQRDERRRAEHVSASDLLDRVHALEEFEEHGRMDSVVGQLHRPGAQHVLQVRDQLLRATRESGVTIDVSSGTDDTSFLRSVVAAFPDRIARRRQATGRRAVMVGGQGVRLADRSAVATAELFACVEVEDTRDADALVQQASQVEPGWLAPELIRSHVEVEFDEERERVRCVRRTRYLDLVLDEAFADTADPTEMGRVLAAAAARNLQRALPLQDEAVQQFLNRVNFLRQWLPNLAWPTWAEDELRGLLPQLCHGRRTFEELRRAPLLETLRGALSSAQLAALERDAPERISAASGSRIRLVYEPGRPPVMPVRIQEMFGQVDTPRVAAGRVPVLLHLLAPNMRTQQITDDLRGFWERAYPIIRKELKRRYPKHAWPDDPAHAPPERRPQRKS